MIKPRNDLTGKKFGKLFVVRQVDDYVSPTGRRESQWFCECDCAEHNTVIVTRSNLMTGNTKSCGCLKKNDSMFASVRENLVGKVFGRLTVLEQATDYVKPNGIHSARWLCQCSCEQKTKKIVLGESLKSGATQSCGCIHFEFISTLNKKENKKDLSGEFGIIWATNTDDEIYFSLCDAEKILSYTWFVESNGYQAASVDGKTIRMHVFLGYEKHDHHNKNKLDNRRENLVKCTCQENNMNRSKNSNNTSGFIGVVWNKRRKKWIAQIMVDYRNIRLGEFIDKEDAIKTRLEAEVKYFGEFAPQKHLFEQYGIKYEKIEI